MNENIKFFIGEKHIPEGNLEAELILMLKNIDDPGIILHADKSVDIEYVVKVMDIANDNKYKLVLATSPK